MGKRPVQGNSAKREERQVIGLRILATTDLHMHLCGHNYYSDEEDTTTGLTRTATLIRQARAEAADTGMAVLLFDNGDALQGTPMADFSAEAAAAGSSCPHPLMQAFAALNYDAIGLGNHDFDFGMDTLYRVLKDAPCPVLSSNINGETGPIQRTETFHIASPGAPDLQVGVLSVLPQQTAKWNAHVLGDRLSIDDMVASARAEAQTLKAAGCDIVVALAHTGLAAATPQSGAENAILPIAALADIDAVIAGHTHLLLPGPDHAGMEWVDAQDGLVLGKPVVMAGAAGSHLGLIDLQLARQGDRWTLQTARSALRPIASHGADGTRTAVAPDPGLSALLAPHHVATRKALQQPVAECPRPLHSFFALFGPDHALALVATAQAAAIAPSLAKDGLGDLPLLSAIAPSKFGGHGGPLHFTHVPAGPITLRHAADLHIFSNEIRVTRLRGAQVAEWLEMSASIFNQVPPGTEGAMLLGPDSPGYYFDVLHGLTYAIDLSQPARFNRDGRCIASHARRVTDIRYQGRPLAPAEDVLVALNSYRLNGGGNFTMLEEGDIVPVPPLELRDAIRAHLQSGGGPVPPYAPPWRIAPLPDTSIEVTTGPAARAYLNEIEDLRPRDLGLGPDGFLHLRLHL